MISTVHTQQCQKQKQLSHAKIEYSELKAMILLLYQFPFPSETMSPRKITWYCCLVSECLLGESLERNSDWLAWHATSWVIALPENRSKTLISSDFLCTADRQESCLETLFLVVTFGPQVVGKEGGAITIRKWPRTHYIFFIEERRKRGKMIEKATNMITRWGGFTGIVFISCRNCWH